MLQQDRPDDYVIATGESHSVREVLDVAFGTLGLDWKKYVETDPRYLRPTEVDHLCGDASKAAAELGWKPRVRFRELIEMMVRSDEADVRATLAGRAPQHLAREPFTVESRLAAEHSSSFPTYNERECVEPIVAAVRAAVPEATIQIVDDNSPDGTGAVADQIAARDPQVRVRHRAQKAGLGAAYLDAFTAALAEGWERIVQMDADFSHNPADVPRLLQALDDGADMAVGSRYVAGGGTAELGTGPSDHQPRGWFLCANGSWGRGSRSDGRVQGMEGRDPAWDRPRGGQRPRLRFPDRDDLPDPARRLPGARGADSVC